MEIVLNQDGTELKYQSNDMNDKINDIFHQCRNDIDINKIIFIKKYVIQLLITI